MTRETDLHERLDRLESESAIRTLVHEYCHGADKRDLRRFAAVWTPDAVWQVAPTQEFRGVEAICAAVEWQWSAFPQMHHWTANLVIDLDGDEARGEVDVSVTTRLPDGAWLRGGGVYRDTYVRTDLGWRISRREAEHLFSLDPRAGQDPGTPDRHEALGAGSGNPER
ncbi:nuclear transport factor 2 family protein [Cellulomonas sp. PS-H5]|uniref:nuclear transport factor 2 family protein n=1 Tax=Cellulomonas sp. PS-H5 TaxID=2820400 RepID=UPI001C4ECC04|nr:nuclear transport factor 2 family protein [Cellulomonas sp. PS-H5]MBW0252835.1 nuclear transport factor 2 family protein [Cellulomonas sp. PS-H5]